MAKKILSGLNFLFCTLLGLLLIGTLTTCNSTENSRTVVVYTSVDQIYSEPILRIFEANTGIKVLAVYDVEAAKTTGLVNRLIAEKNNPKADVFWSGEFALTLLLKEQGVLAPYLSPKSADLPNRYVDADGYWTGIAGRARVLLVNTNLLEPGKYPNSLEDLLDPAYPADQVGIANPLFGTSATHAAALYALWGPEQALDYYKQLQARGVRLLDGNSVVRDLVARGELAFGLTDTDDACVAKLKGDPVEILFLDQGEGQTGTLIMPGTVALIEDAPHNAEGLALIDFLISAEAEKLLIETGWSHIPLRGSEVDAMCLSTRNLQSMDVSFPDVYRQLERAKTELNTLFTR